MVGLLRSFCHAKIHRAYVTDAQLDYAGSVTIDTALLDAVGILPGELVQITSLANGTRWRTYVIAAPSGSGTVCLNGPPARWFRPGDEVIILAEAWLTPDEVAGHTARVVHVDEANRPVRTEVVVLGQGPAPSARPHGTGGVAAAGPGR